MCPATTAEVMMEAMIKVAQDKVAAGDAAEAIKTITTIIDSIVNNEAHVRKTFGQNLVYLYCLRAKLYFETGEAELASQDARQAEAALDEFFAGLDADQKSSARASINAVISPDERLRADGLAAVLQLKTTAPTPAGRSQEQLGKAGATIGVYALLFFIGLILWAIDAGLFYSITLFANSSSWLPLIPMILGAVLLYILIDLSTKGWDWLTDRGVYGWRLKVMLLILLLMTMIGAIPVLYWTGKGALRWYYRKFSR
ncbi:MAG: hypothetical protein JW934_24895 [Anaerolineae bacterium]|nr:hypothetical protein [Anaerolineae bacterium]